MLDNILIYQILTVQNNINIKRYNKSYYYFYENKRKINSKITLSILTQKFIY